MQTGKLRLLCCLVILPILLSCAETRSSEHPSTQNGAGTNQEQTILPQKEEKAVSFSVGYIVECRDVTSENYYKRGKKVIEAIFSVSTRIDGDEEFRNSIKRIVLDIYPNQPEQASSSYRIVDYLPKEPKQFNPVEGGYIKVETEEYEGAVRVTGYVYVAPGRAVGRGTVKGDGKKKTEKYKLVVPNEDLQTSGKTNRDTGVFFKFFRSPRDTLEQERRFAILLEVPKDWRGDYFFIEAKAYRETSSWIFWTKEEICGICKYVVGLYMSGDKEASKRVEALAKEQQRLIDKAIAQQAQNDWLSWINWAFELLHFDVSKYLIKSTTKQVRRSIASYAIWREVESKKNAADYKKFEQALRNVTALSGRQQ